MTSDLTRWNRAGLSRFRYVDGNAVTHLEELRARLAELFPDWAALTLDAPDPSTAARLDRITDQYRAPVTELGWEVARTFTRAVHVLTEHLDAYANEGYLGTATQWENVRRLVDMIDYHPAPPASAWTQLVLEAKEGKSGKVEAGFRVQHLPDAGDPVVFETLEDIDVDAALNSLRLRDHDRSPLVVSGSQITIEEEVDDLLVGDPVVLEHDATGRLEARLISGVTVTDAATAITLNQPILKTDGFTAGHTRVHLAPGDRLTPLGPLSGGGTVGRGLHLLDQPADLHPSEVIYITDGTRTYYRMVTTVRRRVLVVETDIGPLTTEAAYVSKARRLAVTDQGGRDGTLSVLRVAGDYSDLTGRIVADMATVGGTRSLRTYEVFAAVYRPVDAEAAEAGGYTTLRLSDPSGSLDNPQNLWIPPIARQWEVDSFLAPSRDNPLPLDLKAEEPKKTSSGDLVVVVAGRQFAWARADNVAVDPESATATISVSRWRHRSGAPFFATETTVYGHFADTYRLKGWKDNTTAVAGDRLALATLPSALAPARRLLVEQAGTVVEVTVRDVRAAAKEITITPAIPGRLGFTRAGVVVRGNVVKAGHGAAKPPKILGSGIGTAVEAGFTLEVEEVSFVADPTFPNGVRADVTVTIDGRNWEQVATLNDSDPPDSHYTVRMTEDGYVTIGFGDGEHGRRVPAGVNNVRIAHRVGAGLRGNLAAGSVTTPVKPHRLIEAVVQPQPSIGGNDMEGVESLRSNAPASVLTLERAVSLADFSSLAAQQSSVWQAHAFALPTERSKQVSLRVVVVPAGGGQLGGLKDTLQRYLANHAEPGIAIEVERYAPRPFNVAVTAQVDSAAFDPDKVVIDLRSALLAAFSRQRRRLGQDVFLSEVFQVAEGVTGVENSICVINGDPALRRLPAAPNEMAYLDPDGTGVVLEWKEFQL